MTRQYRKCAVFFLATMMMEGESFAPCSLKERRTTISTVSLLPGQGKQLVAAYEAATIKKDQNSSLINPEVEASEVSSLRPSNFEPRKSISAARSFVSRVFHLPSNLVNHRPRDEGWANGLHLPRAASSPKKDDLVLYPIVGFKLVEDEEHHSRVLPTKCNVSCRLRPHNEEVYGWFSPACHLNLYAEDPCEDPGKMI